MKQIFHIIFLLTTINLYSQEQDSIMEDAEGFVVIAPPYVSSEEKVEIATKAQITVYNKTAYELDSFYFGSQFEGKIEVDSSITFLFSGELEMQQGVPLSKVQAKLVGIKQEELFLGTCGTGVSKMRTGTYEFDIVKRDLDGSYYLQWLKHVKE